MTKTKEYFYEGLRVLLTLSFWGSLGLAVLSILANDRMFNAQAPEHVANWVPSVWLGLSLCAGASYLLEVFVGTRIVKLLPEEDKWFYLNDWCLSCKGVDENCKDYSTYDPRALYKHGLVATRGFIGVRDDAMENPLWAAEVERKEEELFETIKGLYK